MAPNVAVSIAMQCLAGTGRLSVAHCETACGDTDTALASTTCPPIAFIAALIADMPQ